MLLLPTTTTATIRHPSSVPPGQVLEDVAVAYFKAKGDRPVTREDKIKPTQAEMVAYVHAEADKSTALETQYVKGAVERFRYQVSMIIAIRNIIGELFSDNDFHIRIIV